MQVQNKIKESNMFIHCGDDKGWTRKKQPDKPPTPKQIKEEANTPL